MLSEAHAPPLVTSPARRLRSPSTAERWIIGVLVTFLLYFPKGGIKLGSVPITWGYLALAGVSTLLPLAIIRGQAWKIRQERLALSLALLPFQCVVWASFLFNGVTGMGFTISLAVTFFFIPYVFLLVIGPALDRMKLDYLFSWIRTGLIFVATYGIFLFFYRLLVGEFFEIPLLTVNAGDFGDLEGKFIDRGGIFKLISTYNNGNIYGVSILMLLPLYAWLERRKLRVGVVKLSLLLTLSRTVWAGLLFYELVQRLYVRRATVREVAFLAGSVILIAGGVLAALQLMGVEAGSFLLDRNLGGRREQLDVLLDASILPRTSFEHVLEMVYFSILENFGLLGLVSFLFAMTSPVVLYLLRSATTSMSEYRRSIAAGMVIYLFVSLSDGALLFIPVAAFYWFLATLLVSTGSADEPTRARPLATVS